MHMLNCQVRLAIGHIWRLVQGSLHLIADKPSATIAITLSIAVAAATIYVVANNCILIETLWPSLRIAGVKFPRQDCMRLV